MQRLFIAVPLTEDVLRLCGQETARVQSALGPLARGVRFVRGENLHFTIKFLGPTPDEMVATISQELAKVARNTAPFELVLQGLHAFPSPSRPRIIYLELSQGAPAMTTLAAAVEKQISVLGFPTEKRGFVAHVTLARVKDFKNSPKIGRCIAALPTPEIARMTAKEIVLYSSQLHPTGSRYTALARCALS